MSEKSKKRERQAMRKVEYLRRCGRMAFGFNPLTLAPDWRVVIRFIE